MVTRIIFSEIYPINIKAVTQLYAWTVQTSSSDATQLGWKLAYRLNKILGRHWIWTGTELVTDQVVSQNLMADALQAIWRDEAVNFGNIRTIEPHQNWISDAQTTADFVAMGFCSELNWKINALLKQYNRKIKNAMVEREYFLRGWTVGNHPALSISVRSNLISDFTLSQWLSNTLDNNILGLLVQDTTSNFKGEVIEQVGYLREHRKRLISFSKRDKMKELLRDAPDNEVVVRVQSGFNHGYDYIGSTLRLLIRTKDYERLGINGQQALNALQIKPEERYQFVNRIANIIHENNWIDNHPFNSENIRNQFLTSKDLGWEAKARLGDNHICSSDMRTILKSLEHHPPFKLSSELHKGQNIRIAVLNLIGDDKSIPACLNNIRQKLHHIQFGVEFTDAQRVSNPTISNLANAIQVLQSKKPHIIMVFLPGSVNHYEEEISLYNQIKSITVGQDIQTQVVYSDTTRNSFAVDNLVLGVLAKIGTVPYVLSKRFEYTDLVAGVDIAREPTKRKSGSVNVAASTRIYSSEGDFIHYILADTPIEGETIPKNIIHTLFPVELFANKRVVIHRDGLFRGDELDIFEEWAREIKSEIYPVEVVKSGVPRLYAKLNQVTIPKMGDTFIINQHEAIVVSSLPIHKNSTPRPLLVRTKGDLLIEQAVNSVLSMTLLHFGSLRPPRLPVTIHYSDRIGYLALRGIKPRTKSGSRPYWL